MAYYLTRFGAVTLPDNVPVVQLPTVPAQTSAVKTLAGGFDAWGSDTAAASFPARVQFSGLVLKSSAAAFQARIDEIRGLARKRALLWRTADTGDLQWASARLMGVNMSSSVKTRRAIEVTLDFEVWEHWRRNSNEGWELDDGSFFDDGLFLDTVPALVTLTTNPQVVSVTNGGNVAVDDAVVTVTAGSAAITALTIESGSAKWSWTGTLAIGKALIVDAGAWSVTNDGVDAYAGFAFDAIHALPGILRINPGTHNVAVSRTGGGTGSTIAIEFAEAWA